MRTFPKSLATFQRLVNARGAQLRTMGLEELKHLAEQPTEHITVEARPATISLIVQSMPDQRLRVVVQGFMNSRFLPGKGVALDGFYKRPDGRVDPMTEPEFYEFD